MSRQLFSRCGETAAKSSHCEEDTNIFLQPLLKSSCMLLSLMMAAISEQEEAERRHFEWPPWPERRARREREKAIIAVIDEHKQPRPDEPR